MSSKKLNPFKDFQSDQIQRSQRSSRKILTAHYACRNEKCRFEFDTTGTTNRILGSFENEALENEDRSTKHPNLENEAPKTRKRSTQDRKRSTQNSKMKHPKLENEAPKSRKRSTLSRKRSTQKTRHRSVLYKHETNVNTAEIKRDNEYSITNRMQSKSTQAPKTRKRSTQISKTKHPKLENLLLLFLLLLFLKGSRKENYAQLLASLVGFRNRELPVPFCQK